MILVLGSTLTLVATFFYFVKSKVCQRFFLEALCEAKYNLLAVKEICFDYLLVLYNKTDLPKKTGQIAVITGGARGIGAVVVKRFLQCDMEVVIGCRKPESGEKLIKEIRKSGVSTGKARIFELDNCSFASVRKFATKIKENYDRVHLLINNAGIMFTPYNETEDGFEQQWQVNYLSHFLLTKLMLPLLENAGKPEEFARIVNVSSCAHLLGSINFNDINNKNDFVTGTVYAQSKLAQTMFTKTLQDEFKARNLCLTTSSVHPGVVNTELFDNTWLRHFKWFLNLFFKTPAQGATPIVFAAVSKSLSNNSAIYINNCIQTSVNPLVHDSKMRAQLFDVSLKQIRLNNFFESSQTQ